MTSPTSQDTMGTAARAPTTPVKSGMQNPSPSPAVVADKATGSQLRGGPSSPGDSSAPAKGVDATKSTEPMSTGTQNGSGGLRQAVQELMASVECLCGDTKDAPGAKVHLEQAKRLLATPARESGSRNASEKGSSTPGVTATKTAGTDDVTRQNSKPATR